MDLIPGLPNDIGRECLIRLPFNQFSSAASVCKGWKTEIELPEFPRHRKAAGQSQKLLVISQSLVNPNRGFRVTNYSVNPNYRLTVFEPRTSNWSELPPVPDFPDGLPMFCQVVSVGSSVVVMGGLDPVTWAVSNSVFVYDFVSAKWRCGVDMPGVRRSFFGCASDLDQTVYVAGGHDEDKNALKSVYAYNVAKDEWMSLPDMTRERDECKGIFHGGKFHVIGGYCTEMQGRFERSAETFDIATWQWDPVQETYLSANVCPRTCAGDDEALYMCYKSDVVALKGDKWQTIGKLPGELLNTACVAAWQGKLLVIGSSKFGEPHVFYVLNLGNQGWEKVKAPLEFSGPVQLGCFLEI